MKKPYSIRIEPALLDKIKAKAKNEKRSTNATIEVALEEYVEHVSKATIKQLDNAYDKGFEDGKNRPFKD